MSLLIPKPPLFFFVRFSSAHTVPIFFLRTVVIRLLRMMPLIPICYMIFSTTAARVNSLLPSPFSLIRNCVEKMAEKLIDTTGIRLIRDLLATKFVWNSVPLRTKGKNKIDLFIYETTYLSTLHVNEGNGCPYDPSPSAYTDLQKTWSKTSESAPTWAAIWPI